MSIPSGLSCSFLAESKKWNGFGVANLRCGCGSCWWLRLKMALLCPANVCVPGLWVRGSSSSSVTRKLLYKRRSVSVTKIRAFFDAPPPPDDPILKEALKEPVAFLGGVFVGLLRLDLKEDPLKEWVARTAQAAGLTSDGEPQSQEETPQQIEIE